MMRAQPSPSSFSVEAENETLRLSGALDIRSLGNAEALLKSARSRQKFRSIDLGGVHILDTPGALLLCTMRKADIEFTGVRPEHRALLDLVCGWSCSACRGGERCLHGASPSPSWAEARARRGRT
jgi:ABC-type transporter Mla MlaB component